MGLTSKAQEVIIEHMFVADLDLDVEHKTLAIEARMAELMGVINAANGELVQITAAVLDENLGVGGGVHTPAQYLGWQMGISPGRARDMIRIASRHDDLPATVAAVCAGKLSVDQAAQIARYVHAHYEADAADVGAMMTVRQVQRAYRRYGYDPDAPDEPDQTGADPEPEDAPADEAEPAPPVRPPTVEEEATVSFGTDEKGWAANIHLPMDQGAVVERGLRATYEDLIRQANLGLAPGETPEQVTYADALIAMAETALLARSDQPTEAAEDIGVAGTFTAPTGERICQWGFHINPAPPAPRHPNPWTDSPPSEPDKASPADDPSSVNGSDNADRPTNQGPPGTTTDTGGCSDPTRAGPHAA